LPSSGRLDLRENGHALAIALLGRLHGMRNLVVKVPEDVWPEFKVRMQAAYPPPSRAIARDLAAGVAADYGRRHDSAKGRSPNQNIQQFSDLTRGRWMDNVSMDWL